MIIVYLDYIVPGSVLLPVALLIPKLRDIPVYIRLLFYYLVFTAVVNATIIIMARNDTPNLWVFHLYTALESFLLLWFFKYITRKPIVLKAVQALMIGFPLFCVINLFFIQGYDNYPSYTRPFEALIFIALCMIYWVQESEADIHWRDNPSNWFITGLLLYFSGAFFLFLFQNYLIEFVTTDVMYIVWYGHATLVMVMYILFAIGFLKCKKQ